MILINVATKSNNRLCTYIYINIFPKFLNNMKLDNMRRKTTIFKIKNLLTVKDRVHRSLRSCVVYKFSCAGCSSAYIGETTRHLSTRVREHSKNSPSCKSLCNESCFKVLDSANNYLNLKVKEALHIMWERPNLNEQLQHYNISSSF